MKSTATVALLLLPLLSQAADPVRFWAIGPRVFYEFGSPRAKGSWGFGAEASYWREFSEALFPSPTNLGGLDFGFEFTRGRMRIYGEAQTGLVVGLSAGPFVDMPLTQVAMAEGPARLGFQGTLWAYYLAGVDYRFRYSGAGLSQSAGLFTKVPFWLAGDLFPGWDAEQSSDDF